MSVGQPREPSWATARKSDEHIEVKLSGPGRGFCLVVFLGGRAEEGARAGWGLQH